MMCFVHDNPVTLASKNNRYCKHFSIIIVFTVLFMDGKCIGFGLSQLINRIHMQITQMVFSVSNI